MSVNEELVVRAILAGTREYLANAQGVVGANEEIAASTEATGMAMKRTTERGYLMNQALFTMRRLMYGVTLATIASAVVAVKWGWQFNSVMQQARVALQPLQSTTFNVNRELDYLFNFTKHTPFQFKDITTAFRTMYIGMSQLGINADTVNQTIKSLVDTLAATGRNSPGQLNRVAYALQHMAYQGHVTGQIVNQLGRDGIPVSALLAKEFGLTGEQIHNIGKLGIPTLAFLKAFNHYVATTPGLANAAYRQSILSFSGLFTTFKDNLSQLMGHIELNFFHKMQSHLVDMNKWFDKIQESAKGGNINDVMLAIGGPGALLIWKRVTDDLHQFWILFSTVVSSIAHNQMFWTAFYGLLTGISIILHIINPFLQVFGSTIVTILVPAFVTWWTVTKLALFWQSALDLELIIANKETRLLSFGQFLLAVATGRYMIATRLATAATWLYVVATTALEAASLRLRVALATLWLLLELNPVVLIITAVVLLTAGLVILYFKWQWFHNLVNNTWRFMINNAPVVAAALTIAFGPIGIAIGGLLLIIKYLDQIKSAYHWLGGLFGGGGGHATTTAKPFFKAPSTPNYPLMGKPFGHLAGGGTVMGAGLSWVGENGPELLSLPRGAQVMPNASSFNLRESWMGGHQSKQPIVVKVMLNRKVLAEAIAEEVATDGARA